MNLKCLLLRSAWLAGVTPQTSAQYPGWPHEGSVFILTTPEGANLPVAALERDFPLLVRLNTAVFDFRQAKPNGEDLRFSAAGRPLAYQVEEWDAARGVASVWVRLHFSLPSFEACPCPGPITVTALSAACRCESR